MVILAPRGLRFLNQIHCTVICIGHFKLYFQELRVVLRVVDMEEARYAIDWMKFSQSTCELQTGPGGSVSVFHMHQTSGTYRNQG